MERKLVSVIIRLEEPKDYREVEHLTREAFWNIYRPGCMEHYVLHCYRSRPEFVKELDYVVEEAGKIVAHIMYSYAQITGDDGRTVPILIFGPVSVLPEEQGKTWRRRWAAAPWLSPAIPDIITGSAFSAAAGWVFIMMEFPAVKKLRSLW